MANMDIMHKRVRVSRAVCMQVDVPIFFLLLTEYLYNGCFTRIVNMDYVSIILACLSIMRCLCVCGIVGVCG
jgi:hypothetical protein